MSNTFEITDKALRDPQITFPPTGVSRAAGERGEPRLAATADVGNAGAKAFPRWYHWATTIGMMGLAVAISLSPRYRIVELSHDRWVELRIEDFLIPFLYLLWGLKILIHGRRRDARRLRDNPLFWPIMAYSAVMVLVTAHGLLRGWIEPARATLYVLKELEFFALFFFVAHHVRSIGQVKVLLGVVLTVAAIVAGWAIYQGKTAYFYTDAGYRAVMPWDPGVFALGGYCLVLLPVVVALLLTPAMGWLRPALLVLGVAVSQALIFSVSRASIFASAVALALLGVLRARVLLAVLVGIGLLLPAISNTWVEARITSAFKGLDQGVVGDSSMGARVYGMWPAWIEMAQESRLIGKGKSAVPVGQVPGVQNPSPIVVADNFYVRTLGELGIFGLLAFLWTLGRGFQTFARGAKRSGEPLIRALSTGLGVSLFGLAVASLATDAFVVVRVIEPFWFLAAMVVAMTAFAQPSAEAAELEGSGGKVARLGIAGMATWTAAIAMSVGLLAWPSREPPEEPPAGVQRTAPPVFESGVFGKGVLVESGFFPGYRLPEPWPEEGTVELWLRTPKAFPVFSVLFATTNAGAVERNAGANYLSLYAFSPEGAERATLYARVAGPGGELCTVGWGLEPPSAYLDRSLHVAMAYGKGNVMLFVDGKLRAGSRNCRLPAGPERDFGITGGNDGGGRMSSVVDEVRISNVMRGGRELGATMRLWPRWPADSRTIFLAHFNGSTQFETFVSRRR